jgi:hypothetical protein
MSKQVWSFCVALWAGTTLLMAGEFYSNSCAPLERKIQQIEANTRHFPGRRYRTNWTTHTQEPNLGSAFSPQPYNDRKPQSEIVLGLFRSWLREGKCETYNAMAENGMGLTVHSYDPVTGPNPAVEIHSPRDGISAPEKLGLNDSQIAAYCKSEKWSAGFEKQLDVFLRRLDSIPHISSNREEHMRDLRFKVSVRNCIPMTKVRFQ